MAALILKSIKQFQLPQAWTLGKASRCWSGFQPSMTVTHTRFCISSNKYNKYDLFIMQWGKSSKKWSCTPTWSAIFCFFQTMSARLWVDWSWFWGYTFIMMRSCCINIQLLKRWLYCLCWWLVLMLLICLYDVTCDCWGDVLFLARRAIASVLYELFRHP